MSDFFGFGGNADYLPRLKYNAQTGRFYRIDRRQNESNQWVSEDVDVSDKLAFACDLTSIKRGWADFNDIPPSIIVSRLDEPRPERPPEIDKDGKPVYRPYARIRVKLNKASGDDVREFGLSSQAVMTAFGALLQSLTAAPEYTQHGQCPIVKFDGADRQKTRYGSSMAPRFKVTGWIDRPEEDFPPETELPTQATNGFTDDEGDGLPF